MKISKRGLLVGFAAAAMAAGIGTPAALAEGTIKIGVILEYSGPFAVQAKEIDNGIKLALEQRGDTVAGKKIEIIRKDTGGPAPDVAKRLATELVTRDKVDLLAGVVLTPNAMAIAPVATEAKVPFVIMNAATSIITTKSPFIVRYSFTLPQVSAPLADWAVKNGIKEAYTLVSDYGPGIDAEKSFSKAFTAAGGKIVGDVRVPLANPDFAPYIQRVKDAKPQAVFVVVPAGAQTIAPNHSLQLGVYDANGNDPGVPTAPIILLRGLQDGPLFPGESVPVTFTFASAGQLTLQVPVQLSVAPHNSVVPSMTNQQTQTVN